MLAQQVQTALRVLFPPTCVGCRDLVSTDYGVCGACWSDLPFVTGPVCNSCGTQILAEDADVEAQCDDCISIARPWNRGRAAFLYRDLARKLVLGLKHSDRHDIGLAAGTWLAQAARPLLRDDTLLVPVPLHWSRLVKRRYNQSALLAQSLATKIEGSVCLDGIVRTQRTKPLDGVSVAERFDRLRGTMSVNPKRAAKIKGAHVLLVDDVMTSGATFSACTEACMTAGAQSVDVLALARVTKDD